MAAGQQTKLLYNQAKENQRFLMGSVDCYHLGSGLINSVAKTAKPTGQAVCR